MSIVDKIKEHRNNVPKELEGIDELDSTTKDYMLYKFLKDNLNDYELDNNNLKLNFNELLLNDIDKKNILEEVIYTISLSMNNIYDNLESVSFLVNNEEIYTINISDIK